MDFFTDLNVLKIAGLVLLVVGAIITFASARISSRCASPRSNLIVKLTGLAMVITGFVFIMFL